ncbi:MAG: hypothetical protein J6S67_13655 [Methanobrevibacter sp.]|nr:hypothetical protein [Methanobrevibacter sp.]
MINTTFNGAEQNELVCFTDIPNIVRIFDNTADGGQKPMYILEFTENPQPTEEEQYYINIQGDSISNTLNYDNANNRRFWCGSNVIDTVQSIVRALRNCPTLAANYDVIDYDNYIYITAKKPFHFRNGLISTTNMSQFINNGSGIQFVDGHYSSLLGNSKLTLDIYKGDEDTYVTTLEKTASGDEVRFDLSPILTTFSEYGDAIHFSYRIGMTDYQGQYTLLMEKDSTSNYITNGYMINQGRKYIDFYVQQITIAQNMQRGKSKNGLLNNTILYIYDYELPISWFWGRLQSTTITVDLLNSKFDVLNTKSFSVNRATDERLHDHIINLGASQLDRDRFRAAFYVDVTIGQNPPIRYAIIKPLLMTEYNQRIMFRNSYGGVSFVDLTSKKELSKTLTTTTYKKSTLDYYDETVHSIEKVYDVNIKDTYTFQSHIFEEDGKWIYNDLLQSSMIWTSINGENYQILLDSVSVDEINNTNNLYRATVKFHLSQPTTLI